MRTVWIIFDILGAMWCAFWMATDIAHHEAGLAAFQGVCLTLCLGYLAYWVFFAEE